MRSIAGLLLVLSFVGPGPAGAKSGKASSAGDIVLGDTVTSAPLESVEYLLEREGEHLSRESVSAPQLAERWVRHDGKMVNLSYLSHPVWFRFSVRNAGAAAPDWVLHIDWALLREIEFHRLDPDTKAWSEPVHASIGEPARHVVMKSRGEMFPLPLAAGQRAHVLLRVEAEEYIVPLSLMRRQEIQAKVHDTSVFMGALFGVLFVMLLYNVSLLVFTRDRNYLDYSIYLLAVFFFEAAVTGYGKLYLWPNNLWLKDQAFHFFGSLTFLTALVFMRRFLNLKEAPRHLDRINRTLIAIWLIGIPIMVWQPHNQTLNLLVRAVGLVVAVMVIYTGLYLVARGQSSARYFAAAWITIALASVANALWTLGVIESNGLVENSQHIGFVVETVMLSIALADRIRQERASTEAAQLRALESTRQMEIEREEKIRAQELALTVQKQANEELEQRVLERTSALEMAMQSLEVANDDLSKLSVTDGLTKVHNRRYFDEVLKREYERAVRTNVPLTLIMIDIDHFKRINDTVGHVGGDECLKLVAMALSSTASRINDLVARYGGEEFAVLLPTTTPEHVQEIAERLRRSVEAIQFIYRGRRVPVSISLGAVSAVPCADRGITEFVSCADKALYEAKHAGRNCMKLAANC